MNRELFHCMFEFWSFQIKIVAWDCCILSEVLWVFLVALGRC